MTHKKSRGRHVESQAWQALYNSQRWHALRHDVLHAAQWRCAMCGRRLYQSPPGPASAVVDHIKPHGGDLSLFWSRSNLQALCKACHDGPKRAAELRGWHDAADSSGWPIDPRHPANRMA